MRNQGATELRDIHGPKRLCWTRIGIYTLLQQQTDVIVDDLATDLVGVVAVWIGVGLMSERPYFFATAIDLCTYRRDYGSYRSG